MYVPQHTSSTSLDIPNTAEKCYGQALGVVRQ